MKSSAWIVASGCSVVLMSATAAAQSQDTTSVVVTTTEPAPVVVAPTPAAWPRIGGHLGLALPIVTLGSTVQLIGRDGTTLGITPGITVKLDAHWSIDFEFVALNSFTNTSVTTLVVDPGVLYNFGPFTAGLRVATQIGARTNFGLIPLAVLPFRISSTFSYFVELDLPVFFRDNTPAFGGGATDIEASLTAQLQTGLAF